MLSFVYGWGEDDLVLGQRSNLLVGKLASSLIEPKNWDRQKIVWVGLPTFYPECLGTGWKEVQLDQPISRFSPPRLGWLGVQAGRVEPPLEVIGRNMEDGTGSKHYVRIWDVIADAAIDGFILNRTQSKTEIRKKSLESVIRKDNQRVTMPRL